MRVDYDSLYPYYKADPNNTFGMPVDVGPETYLRWQKVIDAFFDVQAEMAKAYRDAWDAEYESEAA